MKRKDFIHHAAMAAAGSMLLPLANCKTTPMVIRKTGPATISTRLKICTRLRQSKKHSPW